ncbi:hypothetical protein [Sphingomonas crocodyli]|uniref:Uncharacterized protein n=1 Tax=Sphingomonas crocodyli TaxID=1979270 RepID=A0A437LXV2_9SPHN|nr:hypothetical protein [Sphingomonas crocodyli]RVT90153.1 hypothetical protein EOD43_17765 [Sphingomonas crocodyli]
MQKRYIFLCAAGAIIILLLLILVDVDVGLPVINLLVWPAVAAAGILLLLKKRPRFRRRRSRRGALRSQRPGQPRLIREQPKSLPRRPR